MAHDRLNVMRLNLVYRYRAYDRSGIALAMHLHRSKMTVA